MSKAIQTIHDNSIKDAVTVNAMYAVRIAANWLCSTSSVVHEWILSRSIARWRIPIFTHIEHIMSTDAMADVSTITCIYFVNHTAWWCLVFRDEPCTGNTADGICRIQTALMHCSGTYSTTDTTDGTRSNKADVRSRLVILHACFMAK